MDTRWKKVLRTGFATLLLTSTMDEFAPVAAQPAQGAPPSAGAPAASAPPEGQYAPPPPGYERGNTIYDNAAQRADRAYADQYSRWAAQYCVDRNNRNVAAGAIIGGVLGAAIGAAVAHNPAAGAAVGGAIGVGTGAVAGATAPTYGCPPGYVVAPGAPAFVYTGPYWGQAMVWAPPWYRPWFWVGRRWVYYPYRYWYWWHRAYWQPGWIARPWRYRYYRW